MNRSRLSGIVYLIVLGVLALASARYAASSYFAQTPTEGDSFDHAVTAVRIQPENPIAHESLGVEYVQMNQFGDACESFASAVTLSPNDYRLWLRLASARFLNGEISSSETAFLRAIELAPSYSLPNIKLGRMYLDLGQRDKAFEFLAAAARLDQSYYAEVLKSANVAFGDDPEAIEQAVAPVSAKGRSIVAWYFLDRGWMTEKTHAFLVSDEPSVEEKNTVIRFLKEKRNFLLAREVWLSRLATDGVSADASAPIFDGGFELVSENDASGLGWQIDQKVPSTSIALSKDVHGGKAALDIRFTGNADLRRPVVSQIASVASGKRYTLTFFFLARGLVSGGLPAVLVTDPATNAILGRSDSIQDSKGSWVQKSVTFTSPESAVLISLQRPDCTSQPCPIFGEVAIDDFSISPTQP